MSNVLVACLHFDRAIVDVGLYSQNDGFLAFLWLLSYGEMSGLRYELPTGEVSARLRAWCSELGAVVMWMQRFATGARQKGIALSVGDDDSMWKVLRRRRSAARHDGKRRKRFRSR
jgi:hypothetical protein